MCEVRYNGRATFVHMILQLFIDFNFSSYILTRVNNSVFTRVNNSGGEYLMYKMIE